MGCWQCLPLSVFQLKGKHGRKPHCHNAVVDTFGHKHGATMTTYLINWAAQPLSVVQLKGKHCWKPHCHNRGVDTFRHRHEVTMTTYLINWAAQNGPNDRLFQPYNLKSKWPIENIIISQINYQILRQFFSVHLYLVNESIVVSKLKYEIVKEMATLCVICRHKNSTHFQNAPVLMKARSIYDVSNRP